MTGDADPDRAPEPPAAREGIGERARASVEELSPRQRRQLQRLAFLVSLALIVFLFIMQNRDEVSVSFIVFTAQTRLIWVMVLCLAAGGIAGYLLAGILRRRRDSR